MFGNYPIPPGQTSTVHSDFFVTPPTRKPGQDLLASIFLTDQYGNRHKIKRVIFKGPQKKALDSKACPTEAIYEIEDPIEKQIAAILKNEANQYKACGRRVGGLGSIETTLHGRTYAGLGTECRTPDSPRNQAIIRDEAEVLITSDNAEALIKLHSSLTTDLERERFFQALLKRVNRNTEYAPVGYLILYVSFRLDKLGMVLEKAKADLDGDGAYGFSDFIRLLDGLLRFRHSSFTSNMMDDVERFVRGLNEHTFRIGERLAAIRACRSTESDSVDVN